MKLKLDLHPIFSDSAKIETALQSIIEEAIEKRATEVEIIPGKGSGALKKSVIRFLDRPDIKALYHRMEKDGDNWGRLFVHFRHDRNESPGKQTAPVVAPVPMLEVACACCTEPVSLPEPEEPFDPVLVECPWCGSPNRVRFRRDRANVFHLNARLDYGEG